MPGEGTTNTSVQAHLNNAEDEVVQLSLQTQRFIAKGGWSEITLVQVQLEDGDRSIKEYVRKRARQPKAFKHRELEVHRELHHPNIVEIAAGWYEGELDEHSDIRHLNLLLTPYCPTTLAQLDLPLSEPLVLACASKILEALEYLHAPERSVAHRDLKLENVLVKVQPDHELERLELYLCDFGCAKRIVSTEQNGCEVGEQKIRAPELLRQRGYGTYTVAVDIFAVGLLMCRLLLGTDLLQSRADHVEQLAEYERVFEAAQSDEEIMSVLSKAFIKTESATPPSHTLRVISKALLPSAEVRPPARTLLLEVQGIKTMSNIR